MTDVINKWDEWFDATKDEESRKAWNAAKETWSGNHAMLERWATIIELNRIDRITKTPHVAAFSHVDKTTI